MGTHIRESPLLYTFRLKPYSTSIYEHTKKKEKNKIIKGRKEEEKKNIFFFFFVTSSRTCVRYHLVIVLYIRRIYMYGAVCVRDDEAPYTQRGENILMILKRMVFFG